MREWLSALPDEHRRWFAAFDTRVDQGPAPSRLVRPAAPPGPVVGTGSSGASHPESFYVLDVEGPLAEGELDRARAWGHVSGSVGAGAGLSPPG